MISVVTAFATVSEKVSNNSSVHSLGKGEVVSSILTRSTIKNPNKFSTYDEMAAVLVRIPHRTRRQRVGNMRVICNPVWHSG